MRPLRIISNNFEILGEVDQYLSLFFTRSWHGIGDLELTINRYTKHAHQLLRGNLLYLGPDKVFIIKHREIELNENGKASEDWKIKAKHLKSITGQRITIPPTGAYDSITSEAESVMQHYVTNNVISPSESERAIQEVLLASNQNRGQSLEWKSRYKNLAEELSDISLQSGLGWGIELDTANQKWVFDVQEGKDLTTSQSTNPPVIFSPQFDSLKELSFTDSEINYKNAAYVAGQGEGSDRRIVEVGSDSGINRHEMFVDARDVSETDDNGDPIPEQEIIDTLTTRGQRELNKMIQEQYLEGQVLTHSPFEYEKDYDLGDMVTIRNKEWGVTMDARITVIKEIHEQGGLQIEATFGNSKPTLIDKVKQELSQISGEVRK